MERKSISAFIGAMVDLRDISKVEKPNFYFEANEPLNADFEFKIWNSDKKNSEKPTTGTPLVKAGSMLILTVDATAWTLAADSYYYEIVRQSDGRIFFKGTLEILN